ncbi:serine hydrolase domain-containing protein [Endozoicomonas ascidiicola]|uniref:serine hydrolase domain-containing protein n=1 Tax=Endozoicomonas ascidiicola TaxID=1698521 RepID=UPI0008299509|nr:serine hydrolase [Endozoicomonas ascidiicola]
MKKILITLSITAAFLIAVPPYFLGFSIFNLGHAVQVGTSLSAKLACSARYVSGFDDQQIASDLSSYSPVTELVELQWSESPSQVSANLFGLAPTVATYRDGIGCSLDHDEGFDLDSLAVQKTEIRPDVEWPRGSLVTTINSELQSTLDNIIQQDNEQGLNSRAMVVVQDGKIVAEAYGDNTHPETPLLGWSMAKSVTAMMLGRLELEGKVSRDTSGLFPEWNDERANLKLHDLLQMSSGLTFDETYAPGSDATHMLFTAPSASDVAMTSPQGYKPSTHFSYSSGTTNLLSRYIQQLLDNQPQNTMNFLTRELFAPAGIATATFETDPSGVLVGSSYLYASGRDWARLGLMMAENGEINGYQVLAPEWVEAASTPNNSDNEKAYGYQFWLNRGDEQLRWPSLPEDAYAMMGNRKQSVMVIPSEQVVLVRLGWTSGEYPMEQNYKDLLQSM